MGSQAVLEPHLLDFQIELQGLHLLGKSDLRRGLVRERVSKKGGEARQHRVRALGLFEENERRNRIERVKQEMRVELVAQHRELRARSLALEPLAQSDLVLEQKEIVDPVIERRPGREQSEIEWQRTE